MHIDLIKKIHINPYPKEIKKLIRKLKKNLFKIFYEILTTSNSISFLKKSNLDKIQKYKKLLLISQKLNSNLITKKISKKLYNNLLLDIGILYGDMSSFQDAKYYLSLYLNNIQLPIFEYKKYSFIKSENEFHINKFKKYDLKIICVFYDDSNLFLMLDVYKQFNHYCEIDLAYLKLGNAAGSLSERQLQNIPDYISYKKLKDIDFRQIEAQKLITKYDAIFVGTPIPANSILFKLRDRPIIVSLYRGIDFFPTKGFFNRRNSEIVCLNQISHINFNNQLMPDKIKDYQYIVHYNPKFFGENLPKKLSAKEINKIYFLAQSIVPCSLEGRKNILNMLIKIAKKYSNKSIIIKLRHLENENKGHIHREKYSYQSIAKNMELPSNIFFSSEPFEKVLKNADYCITCSSTAGLETILNGIKTVFYFNYPKSKKEYLYSASKQFFQKSGLISTYEEIIDLKFKKPEEDWLNDFVCGNSSIFKILDSISYQKKSF